MPLNLNFQSTYLFEPVIRVLLRAIPTGNQIEALGLIDTGADISLFDESLAHRADINLENVQFSRLSGIGGNILVRRTEAELTLLGQPELAVVMPIAFAPNVQTNFGNLIGLDVLTFFDFGLSHANRTVHLGVAATQ